MNFYHNKQPSTSTSAQQYGGAMIGGTAAGGSIGNYNRATSVLDSSQLNNSVMLNTT
jgi:hypothetical protein